MKYVSMMYITPVKPLYYCLLVKWNVNYSKTMLTYVCKPSARASHGHACCLVVGHFSASVYTCAEIVYCMARNFWETKFLIKKYYARKLQGLTNYIKPTITIHKLIVHMKMNGSNVRASFEVESMVCGYHCYSTMRIGEEPPYKLDLSNPENIDLLWQKKL